MTPERAKAILEFLRKEEAKLNADVDAMENEPNIGARMYAQVMRTTHVCNILSQIVYEMVKEVAGDET